MLLKGPVGLRIIRKSSVQFSPMHSSDMHESSLIQSYCVYLYIYADVNINDKSGPFFVYYIFIYVFIYNDLLYHIQFFNE